MNLYTYHIQFFFVDENWRNLYRTIIPTYTQLPRIPSICKNEKKIVIKSWENCKPFAKKFLFELLPSKLHALLPEHDLFSLKGHFV